MSKELPTLGEKLVGVNFNPSKNPAVDEIKNDAAALIDKIDKIRNESAIQDVKRAASTAITHVETGCMFAVKSLTAFNA